MGTTFVVNFQKRASIVKAKAKYPVDPKRVVQHLQSSSYLVAGKNTMFLFIILLIVMYGLMPRLAHLEKCSRKCSSLSDICSPCQCSSKFLTSIWCFFFIFSYYYFEGLVHVEGNFALRNKRLKVKCAFGTK